MITAKEFIKLVTLYSLRLNAIDLAEPNRRQHHQK